MARTKKPTSAELAQQLKQAEHKNLMLTHYAMDLREQVNPSAISEEQDFKIELYRPLAAYGGYFIIKIPSKFWILRQRKTIIKFYHITKITYL